VLVIYEPDTIMDMGFLLAGLWATINRGGFYNVTVSVNTLTEAVVL
jgi:hypothetical protein